MSANKELCLQLIMTVLPDYVLLKLARLSKPCSKAYESHNPSYKCLEAAAGNTFICLQHIHIEPPAPVVFLAPVRLGPPSA